jgi:hypothetical protein
MFAVVPDKNDWYRKWAPIVIVDKSFLKIESYRTGELFLIPASTWKFIGS